MGNFSEHIQQSKSNLVFLGQINNLINDRWDWQVTVCFYTALHLINAHVVHKTGKNYLTHNLTNQALNPFNQLSVAKLDEDTFVSYQKLFHLSRRSRYLLNENHQGKGEGEIKPVCLTYDKHFKKAIYHLDKIMVYMKKNYSFSVPKMKVKCVEMKNNSYTFFSEA